MRKREGTAGSEGSNQIMMKYKQEVEGVMGEVWNV